MQIEHRAHPRTRLYPPLLIRVLGFTEEKPKNSYNGNIRHFFGTPRDDVFVGKNIINELRRAEEKDSELNPLKTSLIMQLEKMLDSFIKMAKLKKMNLLEEFQALDPKNTGSVNSIKFEYLLVERMGATLRDVRKLLQVMDHRGRNKVEYGLLVDWLKDPTSKIGEYFDKIL